MKNKINEELIKVKKDLYLKAATEYFDRYGYKSFKMREFEEGIKKEKTKPGRRILTTALTIIPVAIFYFAGKGAESAN